jgi:uncharacterized protein DUF4007
MRFGGHQTFTIRDGWLFKGLRLVMEDPERLGAPDLGDWIGVGKNMAKAIHHWLIATGLAERDPDHGNKTRVLRATDIGNLIWERDRYFLFPGTWWAIHTNLIHRPMDAYSWSWFFNHFSSDRFERPVCVEALRRHIASDGSRMPSSRTLERDVNCMLRSYSVKVPREVGDPEDFLESPLSELGLLLHSRQTGFFHLNRALKPVPFELFGYALAAASNKLGETVVGEERDLSLADLTYRPNSPGRVFCLTAEATYELVASFEAQRLLRLDGQVGERIVRVEERAPTDWLVGYYDSEAQTKEDAA